MPPATKHSRRWYQFGMGTMLWLVVVIALLVAALREHWGRTRAEFLLYEGFPELRQGMLLTLEDNKQEIEAQAQEIQALKRELEALKTAHTSNTPN